MGTNTKGCFLPWLMVVLAALLVGCSGQVGESASPELTLDWEPRINVAQGPGYRGPWRMNRSDWHFVDDPTVDVAGDGSVYVAWVNQKDMDVFLQRYSSKLEPRLSGPVNVSNNPDTFSWLPKIAVNPNRPDHVYVLWQEIIFSGGTHGGEILFSRSTDGGKTFSDPINLSQSMEGDGKGQLTEEHWHNGSLDLAVGPEGTVYTAWTEYEGTLWFRRSTNGGRNFSPARQVSGRPDKPARGPSLAVDGGIVYLAWTVGRTSDANIHVTRLNQRGQTIGPIRTVHDRDGHADAPKIEVTSDGIIHLVFGESSGGPFGTPRILYSRTNGDLQSFSSPKELSRAGYTEGGAHFPSLEGEGNRLVVAWERFPMLNRRPNGLKWVTSNNGGDTFTDPRLVPQSTVEEGFNGSQQGLLREKLALHDNTAAVVNSHFIPGSRSVIWLWKGSLSEDE